MNSNFQTLIKKSLEYFDNNNKKYENEINELTDSFIKGKNIVKNELDDQNSRLKFTSSNFTYEPELLGVYNINAKTFVWSWNFINLPKYLAIQSKYLLKYGLDIGRSSEDFLSEDSFYLKILLCNSRLNIEDEIQLDVLIAICSYILGGRIDFILKKKIKNDKLNIIEFYIVKQIFLN